MSAEVNPNIARLDEAISEWRNEDLEDLEGLERREETPLAQILPAVCLNADGSGYSDTVLGIQKCFDVLGTLFPDETYPEQLYEEYPVLWKFALKLPGFESDAQGVRVQERCHTFLGGRKTTIAYIVGTVLALAIATLGFLHIAKVLTLLPATFPQAAIIGITAGAVASPIIIAVALPLLHRACRH